MPFRFSWRGLSPSEQRLQRWLAVLPGATSWTMLLGMMGLSLWKPVAAAILMIAFLLYWLLRLFYMTLFLVLSWARLAIERDTDWMARVRDIDRPAADAASAGPVRAGARLSQWLHRRARRRLTRAGPPPASEQVHQVVIIPVLRETREVLEPGLASLSKQSFPPSRILIVLAVEERASADVKAQVRALQQAYRAKFLEVLVAMHPEGLPGETPVKGANTTWAAKAAAAWLDTRKIALADTLVSCFDADTVVGREYMACLTYLFLMCPDRTRASFQPIPVYHNNIWEVPAFARLLDIGSSFFQLIEATNPEKLVTFSSHSMSFQALAEVGYWPVDLISDDSAIFWKAFLHYEGRYRVVPMYVTVSMDIADAGTWWETVRQVYRQKRRWAWGVENVPIVLRGFLRTPRIPWPQKLKRGVKLFEGHVAWATWAFLLTIVSWLPAVMAGREFSNSVLYYSAPRIAAIIFNLASLSLATMVVISFCLLPRRPSRMPWFSHLGLALEWLLVPVVVTWLSALPALDAQTRLMLGRPLDFSVTEKSRGTPGRGRRAQPRPAEARRIVI